MYWALSELFKFLYWLLTQSASLWSDHSESHFSLRADVALGDFPASVHPRNNKDRSFVSRTYLLICPIRDVYTLQLLTVTFSLCLCLCMCVCACATCHLFFYPRANGSFLLWCWMLGGRACFKSITIITIDNCRKFPIETIHGQIRVTLFRVIKSDEYFIEHCVLEARRLLWCARGTTKETNVNRCLHGAEAKNLLKCIAWGTKDTLDVGRRCMPISVTDWVGFTTKYRSVLCYLHNISTYLPTYKLLKIIKAYFIGVHVPKTRRSNLCL